MAEALSEKGGTVYLAVRIQPKASRESLHWEPDGRLRIALMAPPVEGAANKALKSLLSKRLRIPKRDITIVGGQRSRDKRLTLHGITLEQARDRLAGSRN